MSIIAVLSVPRLEQSGPVGTNYSRVNPSKEISSQDRDDFWRKEEEEERHRLDLERECRENELLKQEEVLDAETNSSNFFVLIYTFHD